MRARRVLHALPVVVALALLTAGAARALPVALLAGGLILTALMVVALHLGARASGATRALADEIASRAERHRAAVDTAPDAIITIDERRRIESVNPATERLFGYRADELLGQNVSILMDEPDRSQHDAYVRRYVAGGEGRVIGKGREVLARRKDGSVFPVRLAVSEMTVAGRRMFTGIISDMEAQRDAEAALREAAVEAAMAAEQGALSRVATAVAAGGTPHALFATVAEEVARLLGVEAGIVARFGSADEAESVGSWGARLEDRVVSFPLHGGGALARVRRTGLPARVASYPELAGERIGRIARSGGYLSGVAAPVRVDGRLWGAVLAATTRPDPIPDGAEMRLDRFAELVGMAIANAEDRARLLTMATTDPLTGLLNHGAFFERLDTEIDRARRYGRALGLVILDIDHFKRINDTHGHPAGDRVLQEVARRLTGLVRGGDTLARIGGEEFAWLQPESDSHQAQTATERVRRAIGEVDFPGVGRVSISAGICELGPGTGAVELVRNADIALYSAKASGRDIVVRCGSGSAADREQSAEQRVGEGREDSSSAVL